MTNNQHQMSFEFASKLQEIVSANTETLVDKFLSDNPHFKAEDVEICHGHEIKMHGNFYRIWVRPKQEIWRKL